MRFQKLKKHNLPKNIILEKTKKSENCSLNSKYYDKDKKE